MKFCLRPLKIIIFILSLLAVISAAGCSKQTSDDVCIELEILDGKEESVSDAVFPRFLSDNESTQRELDKLNDEVDKIRGFYELRTGMDKKYIVHTYINSVESIPQCTICWYEEHSLLGDDYNLTTLAYNKSSGSIITLKDALNSLDFDGIVLSTNVGKLYNSEHGEGKLTETEMQGFETDESGNVIKIYMKLTIKTPDPEDETNDIDEYHFYCYDPSENTLIPMKELNYRMP